MKLRKHFFQPDTLHPGDVYLRLERQFDGARSDGSLVKFLSYDACPAFVIIETTDGSKDRCLREELIGLRSRDLIEEFQYLWELNNQQFVNCPIKQSHKIIAVNKLGKYSHPKTTINQ